MKSKALPNVGYCGSCEDFVPYAIKKEKNKVTVKDLTFEVVEQVAHCKHCGEALVLEELENDNDLKIYDKYRELSGLLTSQQIKAIRKRRHLSQKELANFLCIGEKDITRYENGAIQTRAIDLMIRMVDDEESFKRMHRIAENCYPNLKLKTN